ncbi:UrcA family protein [Sphingomonas sp. GCM10030256]|uniref:UrcA family protein n=1 Tax=Sphingomonas sp. GCM10030256 TaxID=3273427 RepID=UPI003610F0D9
MSASENILKLFAAGGITLVLLAGTAFAAPRDITVTAPIDPDVRVQRVSYSDLNLAQADDRKLLKGRVGRAIGYVCEPQDAAWFDDDYKVCRTYAWRGATPQINRAVQRAMEIAATGSSAIPPVAIVLAFPGQ